MRYATPREASQVLQVSEKTRPVTGTGTEKYSQLELPLVIDDRTLITSLIQAATQELESSTPESVRISKSQTSFDKPTTCNRSLQTQNSSKKSDGDSTRNEKGFYPFWDKSCQEMSEKLWSRTKTDSSGKVRTLSSGSVNQKMANSWFSTEVTYLQNQKWLRMCDVKSCG
ncbi:hypothetical protein HFV01_16940 [Limnospira fusiformis SAG 85.79]|uniref:Uncharacterized protein n=1 Tax=Limnospira maxima CS-328 TaxID=513049 RepID=B5WA69_LIMMA|nr:hypothetical protein AmaxDRAFT_5669 [Limnospira maxima CS-328]EKD05742.1 hypothetical protein SPLC1_S610010 [Arthrospira platensis C1]QJB27168.1 hypothetical protein HFV01_16940 [Limnospira fusiformis SAG 85.79]